MPVSPKRICNRCRRPYKDRCECRPARQPERRGTSAERGYGAAWQKARKGYLAHHPLCATCEKEGRVVAATVVDHIVPHRGDKERFWDAGNWQALCKRCHDRKTAAGQ